MVIVMNLNKRGFINFTVIYSMLLLISITLLLILNTLSNNYDNNIEYIDDINSSLTECLNNKECWWIIKGSH